MLLADIVADLDEVADFLIDRCAAGDNDELDRLGGMADAVRGAADYLFALRYGG
jgi:hypothetical protein